MIHLDVDRKLREYQIRIAPSNPPPFRLLQDSVLSSWIT
jgi:hypothetical protein